jgi:hypothetical protein
MNIVLFTSKGLDDFKDACLKNPALYQGPAPSLQQYGTFLYPDFSLDSNYPTLLDTNDKDPKWFTDYQNSLLIYRYFGSQAVPLSIMFDERYMAHLTNHEFFEYMTKRWPVGGEHIDKRIKSLYFFQRAPHARNGILRLFWPAYLIAQTNAEESKETFEKKLYCFFKNRIALDRVLERNFSRNGVIFDCCIEAIMNLKEEETITGKKRSGILGKNIVNLLGVTSLDSMSRDEIYAITEKLVKDIAAGVYDFEKDKKKKDDEDEDEEDDDFEDEEDEEEGNQ